MISALSAVLIGGLGAARFFPQQVVDMHWFAERWASAALHLEKLSGKGATYPRLVLPYEDADGYSVLGAFIDDYFRLFTEPVVIQQEAGALSPEPPPAIPEHCFGRVRSEFTEAISDYTTQNAARWLLQPFFGHSRVGYTLVPSAKLVPGWGGGDSNAPGDTRLRTYTIVSAVGFDSHHRRAVLSVSQHYELEGNRLYLLLRKTDATWHTVKTCSGLIVE